MEVFRELEIEADAETMAAVVAEMEQALPDGWTRDREAEEKGSVFPPRDLYCFRCSKAGRRRAAMLVLLQKDSHTFYVPNIVPDVDTGDLSVPEYNRVFGDFYERVFKPVASRFDLRHSATESEADLDRWMDETTEDLLRTFSRRANKWAGTANPHDREAWNAFMLSAYRTGSTLCPSMLVRWLVEEEDWPREVAEQLASEYATARDLLSYAESH